MIEDSDNFVFAWVMSVHLTVSAVKTEHTQAHVPLAISTGSSHATRKPPLYVRERMREKKIDKVSVL